MSGASGASGEDPTQELAIPAPARFGDHAMRLPRSGAVGERVVIESANPRNYHELVNGIADAPPVSLDGQLFLPGGGAARGERLPLVIVVPGSLSVAPSHLRHADTFVALGAAAFVLDPFGGRGVTSTIGNQAQFSFAASAYDVMCAVGVLASHPAVDPGRVHLQGHSRGGTAVLMACMRPLNGHILDWDRPVRAVYAAYPWCGHQPLYPDTRGAAVRIIIGDHDDWCLPQQAQAFAHAMHLSQPEADVTFRLVAGAEHSFDRDEPVQHLPDARVSPSAPTAYLAEDGSFIHPVTGDADPALTDVDLARYARDAGYAVRGATIGSRDDQAAVFQDDMVAFHRRFLGV